VQHVFGVTGTVCNMQGFLCITCILDLLSKWRATSVMQRAATILRGGCSQKEHARHVSRCRFEDFTIWFARKHLLD
jgi:hypothetical protein